MMMHPSLENSVFALTEQMERDEASERIGSTGTVT
jgi:hypothetical protein